MKLELKFKRQVVYDEKANVSFGVIPEFNQKQMNQIKKEKEEKNMITNFKINENLYGEMKKTSFYELADGVNDIKKVYIDIWNRLWKYFEVENYKVQLFPNYEKEIKLTSDELDFLIELLENPYYIDGRVKYPDDAQKEDIQWVSEKLFQIIERRTTITDEIRETFYRVTKNRCLTGKTEFEYIRKSIDNLQKFAFEDEKTVGLLNIKEKELWAIEVSKEIEKTIKKCEKMYFLMHEIKLKDEGIYCGHRQPERLVKDAKMKLKEEVDDK